jgi:6-phosphogluconolactonase/glucosamine-6-phosphate isomerase/deaminase
MTQPEFHTSINPKKEASEYIFNTLKQHLSNGEKVLWLVPGGSAIAVAVQVGDQLQGFNCSNLSVSLTDERYGEVDHSDSSWFQLEKAGFKLSGGHMYPVLLGEEVDETVKEYNETLENLINEANYVVGLFGIGPDGHTAGILPSSPAVVSMDLAFGYQGGKYYRLTTTPKAISLIDEVVVYAVGKEKKETLEKLKEEHSFIEQPAQALKQASKFIIFND